MSADNDQEGFDHWMGKLRKYTLTPRQVELIQNFSDQSRWKDLIRFNQYEGRDPIRNIFKAITKLNLTKDNLAQIKCFAQTCTANNNSY